MMRRPSTIDHRRSTLGPGFTIVELLVVIGIIAILVTLVGVIVSKATKTADKFRLGAQLQAIAVGLDAYKTDFQAYPTTSLAPLPTASGAANYDIDREGLRGARTLCLALMGQCPQGTVTAGPDFPLNRANQDGSDGFGFRVQGRSGVFQFDTTVTPNQLRGKVYGPYLAIDKFKVANTATTAATINGVAYGIGDVVLGNSYDDTAVLLDANGRPILYFPLLNPQAPVGTPQSAASALAFAYVSQGRADRTRDTGSPETSTYPTYTGTAMYNGYDNAAWLPTDVFRILLGDTNGNGVFDVGETPAVRGRYLLWSAGPDGAFGPSEPDPNRRVPGTTWTNASDSNRVARIVELMKTRYDDVTNFQGE